MNETLVKLKSLPLSDLDINEKLNGRTKIFMYRDLKHINDIEQLFNNSNDSVVILYEKKPKIGHWVCMIRYVKKGKPTIEFFDSYGIFPDDQKKHISKEFLKTSEQDFNKIAELLYKASDRYAIEFNDHKLQKWAPGIATCGPHVVSRIMMKDLPLEKCNAFLNSFKDKGLSPDDVVTVIAHYL